MGWGGAKVGTAREGRREEAAPWGTLGRIHLTEEPTRPYQPGDLGHPWDKDI